MAAEGPEKTGMLRSAKTGFPVLSLWSLLNLRRKHASQLALLAQLRVFVWVGLGVDIDVDRSTVANWIMVYVHPPRQANYQGEYVPQKPWEELAMRTRECG